MSPLTNEQAKNFGTSHDQIDCHPKIKDKEGNMLFCQTPNVSKYDVLLLIKSWSSQRGQRESRRAGLEQAVSAQPFMTTQASTGNTVSSATVIAVSNAIMVNVQPAHTGRGTKRPLLVQQQERILCALN